MIGIAKKSHAKINIFLVNKHRKDQSNDPLDGSSKSMSKPQWMSYIPIQDCKMAEEVKLKKKPC